MTKYFSFTEKNKEKRVGRFPQVILTLPTQNISLAGLKAQYEAKMELFLDEVNFHSFPFPRLGTNSIVCPICRLLYWTSMMWLARN